MAIKKGSDVVRYNRLKLILVEKNISQTELAAMLGKDRNTISRICNNRNQPSIQLLYSIAIALDLEIQDLLTPVPTVKEQLGKKKR